MRTLKIFREAARTLAGGALLTGLLLLGGCSQDDDLTAGGDNVAVSFTAGIEAVTRTTNGGDSWIAGDRVGIFMLTTGGSLTISTNVLADNAEYNVTDATTGAMSPDGGTPIYYPQTGNVDFVAYYPYGAASAGSTAAGTVNTTDYTYNISVAGQTSADEQNKLDVLYAKTTNVAKSKTVPVNLAFDHVLSKVTLNVTLGEGLTSLSGSDITAAVFSGMPGAATLALQDGTLTADATGGFSPLKGTVPSGVAYVATFTAILVPQSGTTGRTVTFTVDGKSYTGTIPTGDAFVKGNHYTYPVTVKLSGVEFGAATITDWDTNNHSPGTAVELKDFVKIPAGTFYMGSPTTEPNRQSNETQHEVTLTKDFYMSKYPVTNAQYAAFLNAKQISLSDNYGKGSVSYNDESGNPQTNVIQTFIYTYTSYGLTYSSDTWVPVSGFDNYPVINVTWYGAKAYADWVSQTTGIDCRLPTEAQWEYACRGDYPGKATQTATNPFGIGDGTKLILGMANYYVQYSYELPDGEKNVGNNNGYLGKTSAVGGYSPNNYGLYDMHGNVWEWCGDWYAAYPDTTVTDPDVQSTSSSGTIRVLRGGGWYTGAQFCRSACRFRGFPAIASSDFGFRVAVVP